MSGEFVVPRLVQRLELQRTEPEFEIAATIPPAEMARRVRLAFKRMSEESALIVFARVMTAEVPHEMKVAVWQAVRYSHIWWHVDEVLTGEVMTNPQVQAAFADAVAMRCWRVAHRMPGWQAAYFATAQSVPVAPEGLDEEQRWIRLLTHGRDESLAESLRQAELTGFAPGFLDVNGNNPLWYLTYRDDQQAEGGFACPKTAAALIELGVDPLQRNRLGLCWNDVAGQVACQGGADFS